MSLSPTGLAHKDGTCNTPVCIATLETVLRLNVKAFRTGELRLLDNLGIVCQRSTSLALSAPNHNSGFWVEAHADG